jgi:hypothetical protein
VKDVVIYGVLEVLKKKKSLKPVQSVEVLIGINQKSKRDKTKK